MASFTLSIVGNAAEATELRDRINEVGTAIGYGPRRSRAAVARGAGGWMIRDIGEGRAAVLPQGEDGDFAWLAGELAKLIPGNPERLELLKSALEALDVATRMRERGPVGGKDVGGRFELTQE